MGLFCIAFFTIFIVLISNTEDAKATDVNDTIAEQTEGLTSAPKPNLGLDNSLFSVPDFTGYVDGNGKAQKNNAILMNSKSGTTGDLQAIRMTGSTNQSSAIWSNIDTNYIDISKRQTLSMWLYFGPTTHRTASDGFGDGMAFVLQNGDVPIAHKGNRIGNGESLGVWGIDNDSKASMSTFTSSAIPNSWALEFDTHTNNIDNHDGSESSFDVNFPGQHIAYGYPADAGNYEQTDNGSLFFKSYDYHQVHTGYTQVALHDGKWHHLTIKWNPITFAATFSFNDINPDPDRTKGTNPITMTTARIDPTKFGVVPNNRLRWGFTASTGADYEANLVAFESIPSSVEADVTSTIKDKTQAKDVTDGGNVNSNDALSVNYNLTYQSGRDPWSKIVAKLNLPKSVGYVLDSSGNVGTVTYSDGTSEPIAATELSGTTVNHTLKQNLDSSDRSKLNSATISLNGVADNVPQETTVATERSVIDSDNLIKTVDTPTFTIKKSKPITLSLDKNNMSVDANQDAKIGGTVAYTDGTPINNSNISVHAKLNNTDLDTVQMSDTDPSGRLNLSIPFAKLTKDSNTLEIYIQDEAGNYSATSTVIIAKNGSLSLTVDNNYEFKSINQVSASHLIARKGDWDIEVKDGREVSPKNVWKLSASTAGLYSDGQAFNGDMIYRNASGNESDLTGSVIQVANGIKNVAGLQTTDIGSLWGDSTGIFLRSDGSSIAGTYKGEIAWTLSDTL